MWICFTASLSSYLVPPTSKIIIKFLATCLYSCFNQFYIYFEGRHISLLSSMKFTRNISKKKEKKERLPHTNMVFLSRLTVVGDTQIVLVPAGECTVISLCHIFLNTAHRNRLRSLYQKWRRVKLSVPWLWQNHLLAGIAIVCLSILVKCIIITRTETSGKRNQNWAKIWAWFKQYLIHSSNPNFVCWKTIMTS